MNDLADEETATFITSTNSVELAQAKLNRAVSKWANRRQPGEGTAVERDLFQAMEQFRMTCQTAYQNAMQTTPEHVPPGAPLARQLHIANLLAVVNYPHPIPSGDLVRKEAARRALQMLDLDNVPTP